MTALSPGQSPPLLRIPIFIGKYVLLWIRDTENFSWSVLDGGTGFEPRVVSRPALADQAAGAVKAVRVVEDDDDEAARSGTFRAVGLLTDEGLAVHADGDAGAGGGGGASFDAENAGFADEFVGVFDAESAFTCCAGDDDLAVFLADDEVECIAAHRIDREAGDVGSSGKCLGTGAFEAVRIREARLRHAERFGELVHFSNHGGHGVVIFTAAGENFPADVIGDGEGGEIIRTEQGGVEGVTQAELVAGLEVHGIRPADEGDGLRDGDLGGAEVCAGGGGPIDSDGGEGDFGEASDGALGGGVAGDEDFPGVGFYDHHAFRHLGN